MKWMKNLKIIVATIGFSILVVALLGVSIIAIPVLAVVFVVFITYIVVRVLTEEVDDKYETNSYIPQIKMCVCKGVTTNFSTQNTWKSLENGAPVEIQLGLTFEETELVTGEDVIGETRIGRFKDSGGRF